MVAHVFNQIKVKIQKRKKRNSKMNNIEVPTFMVGPKYKILHFFFFFIINNIHLMNEFKKGQLLTDGGENTREFLFSYSRVES